MYSGVPTTKPVRVRPDWSRRLREAEVSDFGDQPGRRVGVVERRALCPRGGRICRLHEDIRGLQIAVDDSVAVGGVDGQGERCDQLGRLNRRPGRAIDELSERASFHPFHRDKGPVIHMTDLVHVDDVDVFDPGGELGLAEEPQPV